MKELKQFVTTVSNEIYRRRIRRKATRKEKLILEDLKSEVNSRLIRESEQKIAKELWLDKLSGKTNKVGMLNPKRQIDPK